MIPKRCHSLLVFLTRPPSVWSETYLLVSPCSIIVSGMLMLIHSLSLSLTEQLLLTLMKLRLRLKNLHLMIHFGISTGTVTNVFITIISALYDILYVGIMCHHPITKEKCTVFAVVFHTIPKLSDNYRLHRNCTDCTKLQLICIFGSRGHAHG